MHNNIVIKRIISYLIPFKKELLFSILVLVAAISIGFLQPLVIQRITDIGMVQKNMNAIFQSAVFLGFLVILNQLIEMLQTKIFVEIHNQSLYSIFHQTFQKLIHLKRSYFDDKNTTEILNFLQMDVLQVASITDRYVVVCLSYIFRIVSGLIGLCIISWKLALIVLAMVPIKFLLVSYLSKRRKLATDEMIESSRAFSRWFGDNLNGIDEIKLWNLFLEKDREFHEKQSKLLNSEKKGTLIDAWNVFWESILEWGVTILLYILGGALICTGSLTIGAAFAFISYSGYVTGPVSALLNLKMYFARIIPSAKRLFLFLDMEVEEDTGTKILEKNSPKIEFKNVGFSYDKARCILKDVNFFANPGEKIAIIGQNGSGKTTVLNLLLRFYEPDQGAILVDGIDIRKVQLKDLRDLFAVVSQDPYLFLGGIEENINLSKNFNQQQISLAMKASGVSEFMRRMSDEDKKQIGQNGARLSGGEKQKIAVARALLKDAPIIILDEATANFDVESDQYLHNIIVNEMKNKTVIMITHHYENLQGMDRVYRLENGKTMEYQGNLK